MRACVMRDHRLVIDDVADPRPELGQVLVRTRACGICGSDLHFLRHAETMAAMTDELMPSMGELGAISTMQVDVTPPACTSWPTTTTFPGVSPSTCSWLPR